MAAIDEDDRPKKKIAHEIGQDLTLLSVEELAARVAAAARARSRGWKPTWPTSAPSRSAADQFFKR